MIRLALFCLHMFFNYILYMYILVVFFSFVRDDNSFCCDYGFRILSNYIVLNISIIVVFAFSSNHELVSSTHFRSIPHKFVNAMITLVYSMCRYTSNYVSIMFFFGFKTTKNSKKKPYLLCHFIHISMKLERSQLHNKNKICVFLAIFQIIY